MNEDLLTLLEHVKDKPKAGDALLVIDVQNDFCPGGSLPVKDGDKVVEPINGLMEYFRSQNLPIIKTRDWHPRETNHFEEFGGTWPVHCVQNTPGAEFHPALSHLPDTVVVSKGTGQGDSYSGFDGTDEQGRTLEQILRDNNVQRVFVTGLATDYCVKKTVLDALRVGFETVVMLEAVRPVNIHPDDEEQAISDMKIAGAQIG